MNPIPRFASLPALAALSFTLLAAPAALAASPA